MHITFNQPVP